jgi:murein L,D-transpeptidase YcbB/YkuD
VVSAAQKANDLLAAQKEMEIAEAKAKAAVQQAMADNATATYLSGLYAANPQYVALLMAQANASAIKDSDKIIFAPTGEFPYLVLGSETLATIDLPNTTSGGTAP